MNKPSTKLNLSIENTAQLREQIREWKLQGQSIAFVPTMGNLHAGHLSLIDIAKHRADKLVSSVFINPMQFGPHEDLAKYPRTIEKDCLALADHHCDLIYLPPSADLFPDGLEHMTVVQVPDITRRFEGEFRPGHLNGVSTIVLKLFNLVQPDIAVFGKKDYQQWRMISKMAKDLDLDMTIMAGETIRETDGLAMSSRNQYLDNNQRKSAIALRRQILEAVDEIRAGNTQFKELENRSILTLTQHGFEVDYFEVCNQQTLEPGLKGEQLVILAAAKLGATRLIDNAEI